MKTGKVGKNYQLKHGVIATVDKSQGWLWVKHSGANLTFGIQLTAPLDVTFDESEGRLFFAPISATFMSLPATQAQAENLCSKLDAYLEVLPADEAARIDEMVRRDLEEDN